MSMGQVSKVVGARVKRTEDPRMITGAGSYTDDVQLKGAKHMEVLPQPPRPRPNQVLRHLPS